MRDPLNGVSVGVRLKSYPKEGKKTVAFLHLVAFCWEEGWFLSFCAANRGTGPGRLGAGPATRPDGKLPCLDTCVGFDLW